MLTKSAFIWSTNTVITVILWNIITIKNNDSLFKYIFKCDLFQWCKAEFSVKSLKWWFAGQETILITINAGNSCAAGFLRILLLILIIDVFTATLDQLISFLLNKSDNLFKKKHLIDSKILNSSVHGLTQSLYGLNKAVTQRTNVWR